MDAPDRFSYLVQIAERAEGISYRAQDAQTGEHVLLKAVRPALTKDRAVLKQIAASVRRASALSHPAIARPVDIEYRGTDVWIVQQMPPGRPLSELQANDPNLPADAATLAQRIMDSGAAMLGETIGQEPHGALGPESIWVGPDGEITFTDFGTVSLGKGRPEYAAPEQVRPGQAPTFASEQFSLGRIVHEFLTGGTPHAPLTKADGVPRPLARAVNRSQEALATDRFESADALRQAITSSGGLNVAALALPLALAAVVAGAAAVALNPHWLGLGKQASAAVLPDRLTPEDVKRAESLDANVQTLELGGITDELAELAELLRKDKPPPTAGDDFRKELDTAAAAAAQQAYERMKRLMGDIAARRDADQALQSRLRRQLNAKERDLAMALPAAAPALQRDVVHLERWLGAVDDVLSRLERDVYGTVPWLRAGDRRRDIEGLLAGGASDEALDLTTKTIQDLQALQEKLRAIAPAVEPTPPTGPALPGIPAPDEPPVEHDISPDDLIADLDDLVPEDGTPIPDLSNPPDDTAPSPPSDNTKPDNLDDVLQALKDFLNNANARIQIHGDGTWKATIEGNNERIHLAGTWERKDDGVYLQVLFVDRIRVSNAPPIKVIPTKVGIKGLGKLITKIAPLLSKISKNLIKLLNSGKKPSKPTPPFVAPTVPNYTLPILSFQTPAVGLATKTGRVSASGIVGLPGLNAPQINLHGALTQLQGNRFQGTAVVSGNARQYLEGAYVAGTNFGSARVREVFIDKLPPQLNVTQPKGQTSVGDDNAPEYLPGSDMPVTGYAYDANLVAVLVNGQEVPLQDEGLMKSFSTTLKVPPTGSFDVRIEAVDKAGNVTVEHHSPKQASKSLLAVRLRAPRAGEMVNERRVEVHGWIPEQAATATLRVNDAQTPVAADGTFKTWVQANADGQFDIAATYAGPGVNRAERAHPCGRGHDAADGGGHRTRRRHGHEGGTHRRRRIREGAPSGCGLRRCGGVSRSRPTARSGHASCWSRDATASRSRPSIWQATRGRRRRAR